MRTELPLLVFLASLALPAAAKWEYSGTVSLGYWSSNRNLDDAGGQAVTTLQQRLTTDLDGIRVEADFLAATQDATANLGLSVRELFAQYRSDNVVIRVGRQIITWGQADLINPTQRFSTTNYRLRSSQPGLQQGGVDAVRVITSFEAVDVDVVASTFGKGSRIPLGPLQAAGLATREGGNGGNGAFGLRVSNTDAVNAFSASYFRGHDVAPVYRVNPALLANPVHPYLEAWGADYAHNAGDYAIRLEGAYTRNLDKNAAPLPMDQLHVVVGLERKLADYTVSFLYSRKQVMQFSSALLADPITRFNLNAWDQLSASPEDALIRLSRVFDDLGGGFTLVLRKSLVNSSGAALLLQYETVLADGVTLALGFDRFFGNANTYTGALRRNSAGFVVMRLSF